MNKADISTGGTVAKRSWAPLAREIKKTQKIASLQVQCKITPAEKALKWCQVQIDVIETYLKEEGKPF